MSVHSNCSAKCSTTELNKKKLPTKNRSKNIKSKIFIDSLVFLIQRCPITGGVRDYVYGYVDCYEIVRENHFRVFVLKRSPCLRVHEWRVNIIRRAVCVYVVIHNTNTLPVRLPTIMFSRAIAKRFWTRQNGFGETGERPWLPNGFSSFSFCRGFFLFSLPSGADTVIEFPV